MKIKTFEASEQFTWRSWGQGYVNVNGEGHLEVLTVPDSIGRVDLYELVSALYKRSVSLPALVRFPQIIDSQIAKLYAAFSGAMRTFDYNSSYTCAYPLKVNPNAATASRICKSGSRYGMGLEVGSKAELCAALSLLQHTQGPVICNGFKDAAYLELASAASTAGYNIIVVMERVREYELICDMFARGLACPVLGARVKLHASGMGRWEESSGDLSKFGLTASELLEATRALRDAKLLDLLQLLHFHLGSQVTNIRNFKQALQEALRFYVELKELGVPLRTLDVGGGLGVDYDGSNSSSDSSANYTVQEYANDVIYASKEVASRARIKEPNIISETGRFLVAHHMVLLMQPLERPQRNHRTHRAKGRASNTDAVNELEDLAVEINRKNWREYLHDAYQKRDEMLSAFSLGFLSLEQRARAESAFAKVVELASRYAQTSRGNKDEKAALERIASKIYPFNFSLFKSIPDSWILDQLFPIMPVSRLKERPLIKATIGDLTCDSDGAIDQFVHPREIKSTIELHPEPWSDSYILAVLLLGAYQEVLGSSHNLFGTPTEVLVETDGSGNFNFLEIKEPQTCRDILSDWGYDGQFSCEESALQAQPVSPRVDSGTSRSVRRSGGTAFPADGRLRRVVAKVLDSGTYLNQTIAGGDSQLSFIEKTNGQEREQLNVHRPSEEGTGIQYQQYGREEAS